MKKAKYDYMRIMTHILDCKEMTVFSERVRILYCVKEHGNPVPDAVKQVQDEGPVGIHLLRAQPVRHLHIQLVLN